MIELLIPKHSINKPKGKFGSSNYRKKAQDTLYGDK